ncbi:MAG TPA: DUF4349 domain-containing protein, partial [Blastocatellia bacterium]|nr:DUF4349 domain-containing protein [Blastocatellia bacterium]
ADDRKIIRNAELTLQANEPAKAQQSLEQIAESLGGFVVTSELNHSPRGDGTTETSVNVTMRVPSAHFGQALDAMNKLDGKILLEKVSGQDVTEEYIDLDARLKSKRALEAQFLEIMKEARKIPEALEVERELSDVRSEIEQIEGRQRFLENQSSLSTINVHLQQTAPVIVAAKSGLLQSFNLAFGDCIDTASGIITSLIRFLGVLIPVTILILLPVYLVLRLLWKRLMLFLKKPQPAENAAGGA